MTKISIEKETKVTEKNGESKTEVTYWIFDGDRGGLHFSESEFADLKDQINKI